MKRFWWLVLLGLGFSGAACAATFSFGRPVRLTLARLVVSNVAVGDFNGDGRDDVAATAVIRSRWEVQEVSVFLQRTDGTLAAPLRLEVPYAYRGAIAAVDLDGDGASELIVGKDMPGMTVVRLNAGALSAMDQPGQQACGFIATGDIDGDGHADVACHDWKETVWIHYGNGNGGFRASVKMRTPAGTWDEDLKTLRLADVTGDGRLDLLVTASSVNSFFVFPNNGLGAFWPPSVYTHPWSASRVWAAALEVLDIDGDGVNEVVTASPDNRPAASLNVYRRGSNGYLALSERIPIHDSTTALVAGDVDGDGDGDLVAGHFTYNEVTLFGNGGTPLSNQTYFDLPGFGSDIPVVVRQGTSNGLALGDLNQDGCTDLVGATHSGIQVLYGCRAFRDRLPVRDFDGDGVSDLFWRDPEFGEVFLWQMADINAWYDCIPQMYPSIMCPRYTLPRTWFGQAVGDFDGDGNADLFWRDSATGANKISFRALYLADTTAVPSQDWQVVGAGDFDGDDHADVLWRNSASGANAIWKSANSTTQQTIAGITDQAWKVAGVGDFDGDGRSDIFWRHATTGRNEIWRAGRIDLRLVATAVTDQHWTVAGIGDFNRDGKDDVVWRNIATGANTIWMAANSTTQAAVAAVVDQAWFIGPVGDYNGDGLADLIWHNSSNGTSVIWRTANSRQTQAVATVEPRWQFVR
jgi:hypothetical protein